MASEYPTQKQLEETAQKLRAAEDASPDVQAWIDWLRGAFFSHESAVAILRGRLGGLRGLALRWMPPDHPLSVEEARMLNVCRVCRLPALPSAVGGPFLLHYGDEYAHQRCVGGSSE